MKDGALPTQSRNSIQYSIQTRDFGDASPKCNDEVGQAIHMNLSIMISERFRTRILVSIFYCETIQPTLIYLVNEQTKTP